MNRQPGQALDRDTFKILDTSAVIVDHCSFSWGNDGSFDIHRSTNLTVQWSIISETLSPHSFATILTSGIDEYGDHIPRNVSFHHNLWAHNKARSPWIEHKYTADVVNNVIYNWGSGGPLEDFWGTQIGLASVLNYGGAQANVIGNYYVAGPDSNVDPARAIRVANHTNAVEPVVAYVGTDPNYSYDKNLADLDQNSSHAGASGTMLNPTPIGPPNKVSISPTRLSLSVPVDQGGAAGIYDQVVGIGSLVGAGVAIGPMAERDDTDERILAEVTNRLGSIVDAPLEDPAQCE